MIGKYFLSSLISWNHLAIKPWPYIQGCAYDCWISPKFFDLMEPLCNTTLAIYPRMCLWLLNIFQVLWSHGTSLQYNLGHTSQDVVPGDIDTPNTMPSPASQLAPLCTLHLYLTPRRPGNMCSTDQVSTGVLSACWTAIKNAPFSQHMKQSPRQMLLW